MSGRKKKKARENADKEITIQASLETKSDSKKKEESNKMPFDAWFGVKLGRKKAWLREAIRMHMKASGLSNIESEEKFDKAYSKF